MSEDAADEPGIPRAALNKLVKEALPQIRIANDTRDMLHACCLEFIEHIGSEANRICAQELKKTITHEHVLKCMPYVARCSALLTASFVVVALQSLGFAQRRQRRQSSRLDKCGIPEDELLKQQQELFDKVNRCFRLPFPLHCKLSTIRSVSAAQLECHSTEVPFTVLIRLRQSY
ncbi:unnamed protein product [Soboliphyme baturini]|uniref:Protein Dr1 n=1 Tax=Soboliphyme baturini TaxID=241478 RepID=A0A183IF80_9BILA|nr:unnamed protein product [Soboliphyme baturini]